MNYEYFPKLIRAALNNDRKCRSNSFNDRKKIKKEDPEISAEIMKILSCTNAGADVLRSIDMSPIPVDRETRNQLVKLEEPLKIEPPILKESVMNELLQFLQERRLIDKFWNKILCHLIVYYYMGVPELEKH